MREAYYPSSTEGHLPRQKLLLMYICVAISFIFYITLKCVAMFLLYQHFILMYLVGKISFNINTNIL